MSAELEFRPKMLGIVCNWCCYGGADLCGVSRFQYPPFIRLVRVMCSGRVDLAHILRAFANGMDAVFVGGCHINDCHYVTEGNYDAIAMVEVCRELLRRIGLRPERLRLEWVSAGEGIRFAGIMNEYAAQVQKLGPLGQAEGEGLDQAELRLRLEAATRLVPFARLALTGRLRPGVRTEEAYRRFFAGEEFRRLFDELVGDRLAVSRILLLLRERPRSTAELAARLGWSASEVSRHVKSSSKQGLVRFDVARGCYSLAGG
ncbi:MAG: hydrogenase iron-sulfur subunit [Deltaproteobacteria bacterium]|nr:hydrogenase iron-sulfur subunit [Deltaproteobacteria bacterium]